MDMPSKDYVNFVMDKPTLIDRSHAFTLHEMGFIAIIDRNMHQYNKPRCFLPVNPFNFLSQPPPLRSVFHCENTISHNEEIQSRKNDHS